MIERVHDDLGIWPRKLIGDTGYGSAETLAWPTPSPYTTNVDRAKALLAEAGLPNGFETTFHMDISQATLHEPIALLLQEGLARVGIRITIERVPAGQLRWFARRP